MATLALKALHLGADKIPDKAFEAVPGGYFRPKGKDNPLRPKSMSKGKKKNKEENKDRNENQDGNNADNDDSSEEDSGNSGDEQRQPVDENPSTSRELPKAENNDRERNVNQGEAQPSRRPQRPTRRNRRYQSNQSLDRGYESDSMTHDQYQQPRAAPQTTQQPGTFFPPPPMQAYEDDPNYQQPDTYAPDEQATRGFADEQPNMYERDDHDRQEQVSMFGGWKWQDQPQRQNSNISPKTRAPPAQQPQPSVAQRAPSVASSDRYRPAYAPSPEPQQPYQLKRNSINPGYTPHAGYAQQYSSGYQLPNAYASYGHPTQTQQPKSQFQTNQGALAVQPPVARSEMGYSAALVPFTTPVAGYNPEMHGYSTYQPPQDNFNPYSSRSPSPERRHRRRHRSNKSRSGRSDRDDDRSRSRSRSDSRSRSRSRSNSRDRNRSNRGRDSGRNRSSKSRNRSRSMAAQAKEVIKKNRDLGSSALGVVAGGFLGHELGHGNNFGTLAGAVLGGFGANMYEKKHREKKASKRQGSERDSDERAERDYSRERRQQRDSYESTAAKINHTDQDFGRYSRVRSTDGEQRFRSYNERSPHPYARSNRPSQQPTPASPHVHFAGIGPPSTCAQFANHARREIFTDIGIQAMARDFGTQSERAVFASVTKDASTQTPPKRSHKDHNKMFIRNSSERKPTEDKIIQAARAIKRASRKGTWDGSVVEEVFMEMTGVRIGPKGMMQSNWKN